MMDDTNLDPIPGLPPDLAELDQELRELEMAERPSFAPELQAELEAEWARRRSRPPSGWLRHAAAAAAVTISVLGLSVPPARASLVDGLQRVLEVLAEPQGVVVELPEADEAPARELEPVTPALLGGGRVQSPALPPFVPTVSGLMTIPQLLDRDADVKVARRHYPRHLQLAGIGGTVDLALWVDSTGAVDHVQLSGSSGTDELDQAGLRAARELRFLPLTRDGRPDGTWVEFALTFRPPESIAIGPPPAATDEPSAPLLDAGLSSSPGIAVTPPIEVEARELLDGVLRVEVDRETLSRLGPMEGLLEGEPPPGTNPVEWRTEASRALERAVRADPDNPAPYLALARIRRKQGLRYDARLLFQHGLERAEKGVRPISARLVAELAWEQGRVTRESWLGWRGLGTLPAEALAAADCPVAATGVGAVDAEELLAWNFACPRVLQEALESDFRPHGGEGAPEVTAMLASFQRAVEAWPAHVEANREILLALADEEAWQALLNGARRFAHATDGHPWSRLMTGVALHRLGRSEEALEHFERGFAAMDPEEARRLRDPVLLRPLGDDPNGRFYWAALDPILHTEVNEREVEHYARTAYAELRFGSLEADAARVWVRYGRPAKIRAFGQGSGIRTEFWDYGDGPDLVFHRPGWTANGALAPEAEAYLADLRTVLPHRYGSLARESYALPAMVTRFRGRMEGATELEIHAAVPAEIVSSHADSLAFGLFFLGPEGEVVDEVRSVIPATDPEVRALAPAGPGITRVVMELWNPRIGMAVGTRVMAHAGVDWSSPGISEALLIEPLAPGDDDLESIRARARPWTRPALDGETAAILVELYDLPDVDLPYRVDVDAIAADGTLLPLRSRPAGQTGFGREWVRLPSATDPVVEYAEVEISPLPAGRYTLRVAITLDDERTLVTRVEGLVRGESAAGRATQTGADREGFELGF